MEIELKLLLAQQDVSRLRAHPLLAQSTQGAPQLLRMHDIYVDTPDLQLCRHQAGLRVRQVDGRWVQTLKAGGTVSGGLHSRHEWEGEVPGPQPDLAALGSAIGRKQPIRALLRQDAIRGALQPVFTTRMERTVWQLRTPQGDEIECVLDQGVIESGADGAARSVPVSEIELELKQGQASSLFDVALALLQDVPLQLGHMSKAERGYRLAASQPLQAVKAQPLALDAAMSVEQVFLAIAGNCLEQVSGNQDGVAGGEDVESVHQMRVGLRRLRSALGMFKSLLALPDALKDELEWLGGALGEARDWDVLAGNTLAQLDGEAAADAAALAEAAHAQARLKHELAAQAVTSARYTACMLGLQRWLQARAWRDSCSVRQLRRLDAHVRPFARATLRKDQRRLMQRGKRLLHATPQQRHRVRIAAKKTRYATEFFASLFAGRAVKPYVGRLSALQDELGWLNDVQVADRLLRQLPEVQTGQADQVEQSAQDGLRLHAAFVRGYLAAQAQGSDGRMHKAWRRFKAARLPA
ncbi:CHAD domain protein [Janthinobacterium sp. KBS0711]|uniref:CYTH and CHAD domain-containing protein n=1 Tax=Janthinobacterium sp. KBS0711 TaxID=1649647 RepID=UPI0006281B60|nr:CYTH and CHAD domain-containing protein [Janthinobacterium sp. KBS0711]KKO65168.1 CHAD domain protein [Janthinobacterium sp. KBS0711]TSD70968.1 CYTH and CHAD domain-containing protein [Janthinobacterium sp. KBS0711]